MACHRRLERQTRTLINPHEPGVDYREGGFFSDLDSSARATVLRCPLGIRIGSRGVYPWCLAPLAQSAERLHGKEKVYGSSP
jgi:hypothetical protein